MYHKSKNKADDSLMTGKKGFGFFGVFLICLFVFIGIRLFVFDRVKVDGISMEPTLMNGQMVFVKKIGLQNVQRGDIVICQTDDKRLLIKRVIGMPGEHLEMDVQGQVWIDGVLLSDEFQMDVNKDVYPVFDIHLGDNEYYMLGDNRLHSGDSRTFGPFEENQIKGIYLTTFHLPTPMIL